MARKSTRCANCGAKMRLVTATKIDTYRTPEACQYDMSVTGRVPGEAAKTSYRELLCTCCGYRAPAGEAKKAKRAYKKKNRKNGKKKRVGLVIFLVLVLLAIAACVLLYVFRDKAKELLPDSVVNVLSKVLAKARDLIARVK